MKPIDALKGLDLICWPTLLVGFQENWAIKPDIANYAEQLLSKNLDHGDENIAVLESANSLDDSGVNELLLQLAKKPDLPVELDKWRLEKLSALSELDLSEQEKLDKLQELYSEFDYPEDMASCSIYAAGSINPIVAMRCVVESLKSKFI